MLMSTFYTASFYSSLSGLLSTETSTMPGLDECDERKKPGLGNDSFVALHVFQKWFNYAETEKVIGSVSGLARGRGPDTVLCLDTSASMKGEPFQKMIEFAMDFVTGVEALTGLADIEENISVTTIGAVTKVWIHMTSDYSAVKATL
ncbi:uncharacterized protein LOC110445037, partial [Mizuhopecten yessoensis]|uniref:uncharacterized protein LOC110445037 n=1 Tax=Mizuhopecten yessoensis TaxID=6573 RepID=UPI000B45D41D